MPNNKCTAVEPLPRLDGFDDRSFSRDQPTSNYAGGVRQLQDDERENYDAGVRQVVKPKSSNSKKKNKYLEASSNPLTTTTPEIVPAPTQTDLANAMMGVLHDEVHCPVCLEVSLDPQGLKCYHSFCKSCINSLTKNQSIICPTCRQVSNRDEVINNFQLKRIVDAYVKQSSLTEAVIVPPQIASKFCDLCEEQNIQFYCTTCSRYLCKSCLKAHIKTTTCEGDNSRLVSDIIQEHKQVLDDLVDDLQTFKYDLWEKVSVSVAQSNNATDKCLEDLDNYEQKQIKLIQDHMTKQKEEVFAWREAYNSRITEKLNEFETASSAVIEAIRMIQRSEEILSEPSEKLDSEVGRIVVAFSGEVWMPLTVRVKHTGTVGVCVDVDKMPVMEKVIHVYNDTVCLEIVPDPLNVSEILMPGCSCVLPLPPNVIFVPMSTSSMLVPSSSGLNVTSDNFDDPALVTCESHAAVSSDDLPADTSIIPPACARPEISCIRPQSGIFALTKGNLRAPATFDIIPDSAICDLKRSIARLEIRPVGSSNGVCAPASLGVPTSQDSDSAALLNCKASPALQTKDVVETGMESLDMSASAASASQALASSDSPVSAGPDALQASSDKECSPGETCTDVVPGSQPLLNKVKSSSPASEPFVMKFYCVTSKVRLQRETIDICVSEGRLIVLRTAETSRDICRLVMLDAAGREMAVIADGIKHATAVSPVFRKLLTVPTMDGLLQISWKGQTEVLASGEYHHSCTTKKGYTYVVGKDKLGRSQAMHVTIVICEKVIRHIKTRLTIHGLATCAVDERNRSCMYVCDYIPSGSSVDSKTLPKENCLYEMCLVRGRIMRIYTFLPCTGRLHGTRICSFIQGSKILITDEFNNALLLFNVKTKVWHEIKVTENLKAPLAATCSGSKLYITGGNGNKPEERNLYILEEQT